MKNQNIAVLVAAALLVSPITPALSQGGGGGSGGGSGGANASGGASGGGATPGSAGGTTNNGMNSQQTTPTQSMSQTIQDQKNAATTGSNTAPTQNSDGAVSGPGVGVGTAVNGKPIGSPGSGLGSPEDPVDARKLR
jgi:hypothetical protein